MLTDEQKEKIQSEYMKKRSLMDDAFMSSFFMDNPKGAELVLRILLDKDDLIVKEVSSQHRIENLKGHSVVLDVLAVDENEKLYNIEIQNAKTGAGPHRARYHSSLLDTVSLPSGEDFKELPDIYVIFITAKDYYGENEPMYVVKRIVSKTYKDFGDGSHIIYVNGEYVGETPVGKLMHDFRCTNPHEMCYDELRKKSLQLKGFEEEATVPMDDITRKMLDNEILWNNEDIAANFLRAGETDYEKIASCVNLSVEHVKEIAAEISA